MSYIDAVIAERFRTKADAQFILETLDIHLMYAGKQVETIHDLVVFPECEVDEEAVTAGLIALLALLGQLGGLVRALRPATTVDPSRDVVAADAARHDDAR